MNRKERLDIIVNEFLKMAEIPRPSHHEERISSYLLEWAERHGLKAERDEWMNVVIEKPASPGYENAPMVILQAHTDMVCAAEEDVSFDPQNDPIRVINDGETLTADGTSLGADDGIGVAICLYILQDDSLNHGPLRVILTADEEDGMDSMNLDPAFLRGDFLINIDHERSGSLCNSCAGGDQYHFIRKPETETVRDGIMFSVTLGDLTGGHSGISINEGRANAVTSLAEFLCRLHMEGIGFRIVSFTGGQAANAIPKNASVSFIIPDPGCAAAVRRAAEEFQTAFRSGYRHIEEDFTFTVSEREAENTTALSAGLSVRLVQLMTVVPQNVHTMSPFIDGLVESSANLGMIRVGTEDIRFLLFARSSSDHYAEQLNLICSVLAERFGFDLASDGHTPAWEIRPESRLTQIACEEYRKLTGKEMIVSPIHAGLECGAFAQKNPDLDMIAIGPTLFDIHTPDETCPLKEVAETADLVVNILEAAQSR